MENSIYNPLEVTGDNIETAMAIATKCNIHNYLPCVQILMHVSKLTHLMVWLLPFQRYEVIDVAMNQSKNLILLATVICKLKISLFDSKHITIEKYI